jgi:two-component system, OmpR family, heavy metal sensor histidine kinase CusS
MSAAARPYSITRRLATRVALQVALLLALMAGAIYGAAAWLMERKQAAEQTQQMALIAAIAGDSAAKGGPEMAADKLAATAQRRPNTRLEVRDQAGRVFYRDPDEEPFMLSDKVRRAAFTIDLTAHGGARLGATLAVDVEKDAGMMDDLTWALLLVPLVGGALAGVSTAWRVQRELRPLLQLAAMTRRISPERLDQRLALPVVAEELAPWVTQFNMLMDRLQATIEQLEAFNADVAHELRTPIAALMGHTEVALSRERPAAELRETMATSLEEMQRLSAIVGDMLFLSQADRGAVARRGQPQSLRTLAQQVLEIHEFALEDAGLAARVDGDAVAAVDGALVQRALSNLMSNATRFAVRGSTVVLQIDPGASSGEVNVSVRNEGPTVEPALLPRLFDRFFRAESARSACTLHHGLGLAIVAAIARMHGGRTTAASADGVTSIGFTLSAA